MPTEVDIFIRNVINAVKLKNSESLKSLIENGPNLNQKDNNGFNAAMYLGKETDIPSCVFLANHGGRIDDFIGGAARRE